MAVRPPVRSYSTSYHYVVTDETPANGKPRNEQGERPRDEFGRPLPWGSESRLALEDYDNLPLEDNERLAIEAFNEGVYFSAHEAWEAAWRLSRGGSDEEFFKGLAQMGAGYTHMQRGNAHGAKTLLTRARTRLESYRPRHRGLDLERLCATLDEHCQAFSDDETAGRAPRHVEPPPIERSAS